VPQPELNLLIGTGNGVRITFQSGRGPPMQPPLQNHSFSANDLRFLNTAENLLKPVWHNIQNERGHPPSRPVLTSPNHSSNLQTTGRVSNHSNVRRTRWIGSQPLKSSVTNHAVSPTRGAPRRQPLHPGRHRPHPARDLRTS